MALKPDAQEWTIKEQIIEDRVTGLTLQFEIAPDGTPRLRIFGEGLPYGNRDIAFDHDGTKAGSGTSVSGLCRPAWLIPIEFGEPNETIKELRDAGLSAWDDIDDPAAFLQEF